MNRLEYIGFLTKNGHSLSELNPGSTEFALTISDSLLLLELLKNTQFAILGGEILSEKNNKLIYAYQLWGEKYHSLNWYCNQSENESQENYVCRSYIVAREKILKANEIAKRNSYKIYVVLGIEEYKKIIMPRPTMH